MTAITGSHEYDGGWASRPQQSVNYLSCHDGKTLADIVDGDVKRQFLGLLLILTSQGIPMIYEGSELMYSKQGEHNTYDRPDLNQIDWSLATEHDALIQATVGLIAVRQRFPHFKYQRHVRRRNGDDAAWDIDFIYPNGYPHEDNAGAIGFMLLPPDDSALGGPSGDHRQPKRARPRDLDPIVVLLNGSSQGADFSLPDGAWKTLVDGHNLQADPDGLEATIAVAHYYVHPGTGVVLAPEGRLLPA